jgi:putative copper resistance protein D
VLAILDVLLRGLILAAQAVTIGGVCFVLLAPRGTEVSRSLRLVAAAAVALAAGQALALAGELYELLREAAWPLGAALGTSYVQVSLVRIGVGLALAACAVRLRRPAPSRLWAAAIALTAALVVAAPGTSHAAARLDSRALLLVLDGAHQLAAAVWIGGLVHLTAAAIGRGERPWAVTLLRRFSNLARGAVALLLAAGVALAWHYAPGPEALLGTTYGLMILTKLAILAALLVLGALNSRAIRRPAGAAGPDQAVLRAFVEVEVGLGLTALLVAASLTTAPPAVDLTRDRATPAEVAARFTPKMPTLRSPAHSEVPVGDPLAPRSAADRAWSEFNHHVSGILVLGMGLLALLHASGRAGWARHWPLLFLALAALIVVRGDPDSWPLGPGGFWSGWLVATVAQHRIFAMLVIGFGIVEWLVRTGRLRSRRAAAIFPLLCAVGGSLLLTHTHTSVNLKEEFLLEVTHAPLGLLALLVGWTRWLELRLPETHRRLPGALWATGLVLVGLVLLLYRET